MIKIAIFFSSLINIINSYIGSLFIQTQDSPFSLKKRSKLQHTTILLLLLLFLIGFSFVIIIFSSISNKITIGDSVLTNIVVDKELTQSIPQKIIETKEELQKLASNTPISFSFYRILPGENLSSIANKFGLSIATVLSLNSLDNAHSLSVGQKILLATRSGIIYNTTNQDTISNIADRYGISATDTLEINNLKTDEVSAGTTLFLPEANLTIKAMAELLGFQFINPVPKYRRISSHFGWRRHPILKQRILHKGIDFAAPIGTPIVAPKEGRVTFAGWYGSFGLTVIIRHNNGFTTLYAHQSKLFVETGQWVSIGQQIGSVGNTGRSTGPHLHFEIRKYGQPRNPVYNGLQL